MRHSITLQRNFLRALLKISARRADPVRARALTEEMRETLLRLGSETPDNLRCAETIEIGEVQDSARANVVNLGLRVRGSNILLSEFLYDLEDVGVPDALRSRYPQLGDDDLEAILRIVSLVFSALERPRAATTSGGS